MLSKTLCGITFCFIFLFIIVQYFITAETDCDETLKKLRKEEELLSSRRTFAFESDAFGGDHAQELIEQYDEEAEKHWRGNYLLLLILCLSFIYINFYYIQSSN